MLTKQKNGGTQVWGVTIGTAILQTQLHTRLPPSFVSTLPSGVSLAYSSIPSIATLPEPLRTEVRRAFAESLRVVWVVLTAIAGVGMLASLGMRGVGLGGEVDGRYAMEEEEKGKECEEAGEKA